LRDRRAHPGQELSVYIPEAFRESDPATLHSFVRDNSFGTLVSNTPEGPFATHLPFLLDAGRNVLVGHMARANPHWQSLEGQVGLAIFQGPHAYVSPRWYTTPVAVPTWNYAVVHARGRVSLIQEGERLLEILAETVRRYDPTWPMPEGEYVPKLAKGVVGFEIAIERLEGKMKLSQNRGREDREGAIAGLRGEGQEGLAEMMERALR
jgi:transcriptional regulator